MTVAELILERLKIWGVRRVFGLPGDGVAGFLNAFESVKDPPTFVEVKQGESATVMACSHAKATAELGVCLGSVGRGVIDLLKELQAAQAFQMPVLALGGLSSRGPCDSVQAEDLTFPRTHEAPELFFQASSPVQVDRLVDRAVRTALAERKVTCLIVPEDLQRAEALTAEAEERVVESDLLVQAKRDSPFKVLWGGSLR
jgi:pyruvate dehydrogenase (quinone)